MTMKMLKKFAILSLVFALSVCMLSACGSKNAKTDNAVSEIPSDPTVAISQGNSEAVALSESFVALPTLADITNADVFTESFTTYADLYTKIIDLSIANPADASVQAVLAQITNCSSEWINKSLDFETFESEAQAKNFFEKYDENYAKIQAGLEKLLQ